MRAPLEVWSGGQTGVDQAALDAAIFLGIPHGGYCPRGRRREGGMIPARYKLTETRSDRYEERTRANVVESTATLVVTMGRRMSPGSALTWQIAENWYRCRHHWVVSEPGAMAQARAWLRRIRPERLNIAGSRESKARGIYQRVYGELVSMLDPYWAELQPSQMDLGI